MGLALMPLDRLTTGFMDERERSVVLARRNELYAALEQATMTDEEWTDTKAARELASRRALEEEGRKAREALRAQQDKGLNRLSSGKVVHGR